MRDSFIGPGRGNVAKPIVLHVKPSAAITRRDEDHVALTGRRQGGFQGGGRIDRHLGRLDGRRGGRRRQNCQHCGQLPHRNIIIS